MRRNTFRALAPVLILALLIPLSSSLSARDPRPQERQLRPPAFSPNSDLPPGRIGPLSRGLKWARTYQSFFGFPEPKTYETDHCVGALPRGDGGIVVAASVKYDSPDHKGYRSNILVLGLNSSGAVDWKIFYEADPNLICWDYAEAMIRTSTGEYLLVGAKGADDVSPTEPLVMKINPQGGVLWVKTYHITVLDGGSWIVAKTIAETQDGGFLVAGRGGVGVWLMKLDSQGNALWNKDLSNGFWIYGCSLQAAPDGGFLLAGLPDTLGDIELFKLDGNASVQWQKRYVSDFLAKDSTAFRGITVLKDGGCLLMGSIHVRCDGGHVCFLGGWVCRLDASGEIVWQRGYPEFVPVSAFETSDGGIFIIDNRFCALLKLTASGDVQWTRYVNTAEGWLSLASGFQDEGGGFVVGYDKLYYSPNQMALIGVMRLGSTGLIGSACPLVTEATAEEMAPLIRVMPGSGLVTGVSSAQARSRAYSQIARFFMGKIVCGPGPNR